MTQNKQVKVHKKPRNMQSGEGNTWVLKVAMGSKDFYLFILKKHTF